VEQQEQDFRHKRSTFFRGLCREKVALVGAADLFFSGSRQADPNFDYELRASSQKSRVKRGGAFIAG
jgi:hypothetical protein